MNCLHCGLWEVVPEAVAGLCDSCAWGVRYGLYAVAADQLGVKIVTPQARPGYPLGSESGGPVEVAYEPPEHERGEYTTQLLALAYGRVSGRLSETARQVIEAIRASGCEIALDTQSGRAVLSHPRRVPYPVLVALTEQTERVEDELMREREEAKELTRNVQVEHFATHGRTEGHATETSGPVAGIGDASRREEAAPGRQEARATVRTL